MNKSETSKKEIEYEKLSLFFDEYVSNNKLITKYASIAGLARIPYIKGKDLKKFFTENFAEIKQEIILIIREGINISVIFLIFLFLYLMYKIHYR